MIETTKATCAMCGQQYDDTYVVPRAPFAPHWCEDCKQDANAECGSWLAAVYGAIRDENPWEVA